jgi:hypothetical protein
MPVATRQRCSFCSGARQDQPDSAVVVASAGAAICKSCATAALVALNQHERTAYPPPYDPSWSYLTHERFCSLLKLLGIAPTNSEIYLVLARSVNTEPSLMLEIPALLAFLQRPDAQLRLHHDSRGRIGETRWGHLRKIAKYLEASSQEVMPV